MEYVKSGSASDVLTKEDVFIIPEGEIYKGNITVKGGILIVKGVLKGNIVAVRGKVKITGRVEGALIAVYSKLFLSGDVRNLNVVYSDLIFDGGKYGTAQIVSCRVEVLRKIMIGELIKVNSPLLSMYLSLVLGYALSFL